MHPHARNHVHLYAQVLFSKANVSKEAGDLVLSKECFVEALSLFRQLGDKQQVAWALSHLGDRACGDADYATARQLLDESVALFREVDDQKGLAWALIWRGIVESDQGNFQQALHSCGEATQIADKIKSPVMSYLTAGWTAFVYITIGDLDQARKLAEKALAICNANRLIGSATIMLGTLGRIALYQGDIDYAILQLERARDGQEQHGNPDLRAGTLIHLGFAEHLRGNSAQAESYLQEALQAHWATQRISLIPDNLMRLAWISVDQRDLPRAVRLMGAVAAIHSQLSSTPPASDQIYNTPRLNAAQSTLSATDFECFWREGQAMDCKAAVDYALGSVVNHLSNSVA
jgi:tetratricopeptide (TPR) repeat protein